MSSDPKKEAFSAAVDKLDKALDRLEGSVRGLSGRMRSSAQLEEELAYANARAARLDVATDEVSQRLDDAIESVRTVLEQA